MSRARQAFPRESRARQACARESRAGLTIGGALACPPVTTVTTRHHHRVLSWHDKISRILSLTSQGVTGVTTYFCILYVKTKTRYSRACAAKEVVTVVTLTVTRESLAS